MINLYPSVRYPDPAAQSSLHDLYWEETNHRPDGMLKALKGDPRLLYVDFAPVEEHFRKNFQPSEYPRFLKDLAAAYAAKAAAQPEDAEVLNRYRDQVLEEIKRIEGE